MLFKCLIRKSVHRYPWCVTQGRKLSCLYLHIEAVLVLVSPLDALIFSFYRATAQTAQKQQFEYGFHKHRDFVCKLAIIPDNSLHVLVFR